MAKIIRITENQFKNIIENTLNENVLNNVYFLNELKTLLAKHNATIEFTCGEDCDTHGFYDDHIQVKVDNKVVLKTSTWELTQSDIK